MALLNQSMGESEKYFLKSSRLGFRLWCEGDLGLALQLWGDHAVTQYFDARGRWSRDAVRQRLAQEISTAKIHGVQYWPIFLLETDAHMGCCGLRPYDPTRRVFEIGFHIRSDQWRRGYAREAAEAVINYAFNTLNVKGLFAGHNPRNTVSQHLLQQLGFHYTHDEYYPPTGLNHPSYYLNANEHLGSRC